MVDINNLLLTELKKQLPPSEEIYASEVYSAAGYEYKLNILKVFFDKLPSVWKQFTQFEDGSIEPKTPNVLHLVSNYLNEVQKLVDKSKESVVSGNIRFSTDTTLDNYGDLYKIKRSNRGDDEYRGVILSKINVLNTSGTTPDILNLVGAISLKSSDSYSMDITEAYPSTRFGVVWLAGGCLSKDMGNSIDDASPSGSKLHSVWSPYNNILIPAIYVSSLFSDNLQAITDTINEDINA